MKKIFTLLVCLFSLNVLLAQRISVTTDIFGDLQYSDDDMKYKATLKKDIFDALIFTDNKQNSITYEKKFIDIKFPGILSNKQRKTDMFMDLIREQFDNQKYVTKYSVTIFDKVLIEDNRGYRFEQDLDMFVRQGQNQGGNNANKYGRIKKDAYGNLSLRDGRETASLIRDNRSNWSYEDSLGNRFEFGRKTWNQLMRRYRSAEDVFLSIVDEYFY